MVVGAAKQAKQAPMHASQKLTAHMMQELFTRTANRPSARLGSVVRLSANKQPVCLIRNLQIEAMHAGPISRGDLHSQVGSKNAAFYLGKCIKMSTKQAGVRYVHELSISAAELEKRYKQGEVRWMHLDALHDSAPGRVNAWHLHACPAGNDAHPSAATR